MSPCSPLDVSIDLPDGPSGPAINGFGIPFSIPLDGINIFPDGFPEDILDLLNKLQMLIPPGALKPNLNPNFSKDIFDAIMKVLDQFLPFLMLYKFFLPILKLLLCIIEVLCAIPNPIKLSKAIKKLFRSCLPDFLNLFPIFALIMMLISLLLLILALIEYIISQIIKFIKAIIRNIKALVNAIKRADDTSILAIAKKLGSLLCIFQNLFVLFALFNIIIQIFRDILSLAFAIPPCDDSADGCCSTDVCPQIVKGQVQRKTGKLQYFPKVQALPPFTLSAPLPPALASMFNADLRSESWQLYDTEQFTVQQFRNIFDAYDVTVTPKPVFFPTDVVYTATTPAAQAAYTADVKMFYNPTVWSRTGTARWIRFMDCIVLATPLGSILQYDNSFTSGNTGVLRLGGGLGYEDDGVTPLTGFATDGYTPITDQATFGNFLHKSDKISVDGVLYNDGYLVSNIEYIFKPNLPVLVSKDLITLGCLPDIATDRTFVNNVLVGDANITLQSLNNFIKIENGFPDPAGAQACLTTALSGLRGNLTIAGAAQFQATALICLAKLKADTEKAIGGLVGLGFDPCKSKVTLNPTTQFTSRPIEILVDLNERNGTSLTLNLSPTIAADIATRLKAYINTKSVSVTNFTYDGYQLFKAELSSTKPVSNILSASFDDQIFCTNILPSDITLPATHTLQTIDFKFIYAPGIDSDKPRRDAGDTSRDGGNKGSE